MSSYFKIILIPIFAFITFFNANATHIVGGEVYYDSLGNNQYRVTFEIYRNCWGTNAGYDNPLQYTVFYGNGTVYGEYPVNIDTRDTLPLVAYNPCITVPTDICVERAIYTDIITLPWNAEGFHISYQRCCWTNAIDNLFDPGSNGTTITTFIPGSALVGSYNQSARFNNLPPILLCANVPLVFDYSATDPDGDSLVYELADPLYGGSIANSIPNPETAPPYTSSQWASANYSTTSPFGTGSSVTVNSASGEIVFTPTDIGFYVASVAVKEYRNGVLINTSSRTFGYRVVACQIQDPVVVDLIDPSLTTLIEDCGEAGFIISRNDAVDSLTVYIELSGSGVNGDDYSFLPDSIVIMPGVFSDTLALSALLDTNIEATETVTISVIIQNICDSTDFDTSSVTLDIYDYQPLTISSLDSINVCDELGESPGIWCDVNMGVEPYSYVWDPLNLPNFDSVLVSPNLLNPNLNNFTVTVTDVCGKSITSEIIKVYNQCPLIVPNVITANGDQINDFLEIKNWEDYDIVSIIIINRWGELIYENNDYKNDWNGTDMSGNEVDNGVYFYTVTPKSIKFEYDDQEETKFTAHGFVHVLREK